MASIFSGLSTAISGLYANKKALDTTSHNLSNVNNPDYVRQQTINSSSRYSGIDGDKFKIGQGVDIQEIRQIRDEFLDIRYRDQSNIKGYWEARNDVFQQVQEIMDEMNETGLQKVMDDLWNSFDELSKDPSNLTVRGLFKERSIAFVETVNHIDSQIDLLQRNLNKEIQNKVDEVNGIAKELSKLNEAIMTTEYNGVSANDFRDRRNGLLDRLSQLTSIKYNEKVSGAVDVYVGGVQLVSNNEYREMETQNINSSFYDVYWKDMPSPTKVDLGGGEILGLITSRGDVEETIVKQNNGSVDPKVDVKFIDGNGAIDTGKYQTDLEDRISPADVNNVEIDPFNITAGYNIDNLIADIKGSTFANNHHKKLIISTDESLPDPPSDKLNDLKELGVSITIITDDPTSGWSDVAAVTSGKIFDSKDSNLTPEKVAAETTYSLSNEVGSEKDYTEIIPTIKKKLNNFVNTVATNINYIHRQGKTLLGDPGENLFVAMNPSTEIEAGNIMLNPKMDTLNNIAASASGDTGDGEIAERIVNLRDEYIFGDLTSDDYYRNIISEVGVAANESITMEESQNIIINNIENDRKSISGVSMDEEMTDMLKFQHAYTANSRIVNAIDEMANNIINKMGRVGN